LRPRRHGEILHPDTAAQHRVAADERQTRGRAPSRATSVHSGRSQLNAVVRRTKREGCTYDEP
jgi:uncharacterized protein involved in type VI secretion and phage assembly